MLRTPYKDRCFNGEYDEETTKHLNCHCLAFGDLRRRILAQQILIDKTCLSIGDLNNIHTFIKNTRCLQARDLSWEYSGNFHRFCHIAKDNIFQTKFSIGNT